MTTAEPARPVGDPGDSEIGELQPFPGRFVPGICFESGHCFWLLEFDATPTRFGAYTEFWVVTPEGDRLLYTDPGEATEAVLEYHDFDRTAGASINTDVAPGRLEVTVESAGGLSVDLAADIGHTVGTRILNGVIDVTPPPVLRSRVGSTVSTLAMNLLLEANGLQVAGRTETDRRYRLDADRIAIIEDATATLDGDDLGPRCPPGRPIEFGDAKTTGDALFVPGRLQLERFEA